MTQKQIHRWIVREPSDRTAGLGVAYNPAAGPHETPYTVEQLWPNGEAEPVYVGDRDDVVALIETLASALGET
jgi:hypothetical protein